MEVRDGSKTTGGLGDGSPPAGSRGGPPLGGLGKLNSFKSSYKQILRIFGSISHIFTYICPCFSVLAGIILLSLRNGGGGHLIPFAPLVCKWGATAPSAPSGSAAYAFKDFPIQGFSRTCGNSTQYVCLISAS